MSNHKHRETQAIISYEKASLYGDRTKHRDGRESNHNTKTDTMDHCNVSNETASEYGGGGNERLWLWGAWRLWWRLRWRRIWEVMVVVTSDGWWERWRWLWERAMLVMTSVTVVLATPVKTYLRSEGGSDERWWWWWWWWWWRTAVAFSFSTLNSISSLSLFRRSEKSKLKKKE